MPFKVSLEVGGIKISIENWLNLKTIYILGFKFDKKLSNFLSVFRYIL